MQTSLCKSQKGLLPLLLFFLLISEQPTVAQTPASVPVVAKLSLTQAESYRVGYENQSELIRKERAAHPESGDGHGGWYVKVEFPRHPPSPQEITVEFSFHIEKDPFHPHHPTEGDVGIVDFSYLKPLSFKVTQNGSINYAFGEVAEKLETTTRLIRRRMNWQPFEIFVPWELFHLYELFDTPEKLAMDGFRIGVYIKADIYRNGRRLGGGQNIPIVYHINEVESSGMEIEHLGTDDITSLFDEETPTPSSETYVGIARISDNLTFVTYGNDGGEEPPTPHQHNFVTTISFGTPWEVKTEKPVQFDFPKYVVLKNDGNDHIFNKVVSDLGNNLYIGQFQTKFNTLADAERHVAHLNDSLRNAGAGVVLRLPTKKEMSKILDDSSYEGVADDFESFYNPDYFLMLVVEYNKDRDGIVVVPDHVAVIETHTQKCSSCEETRRFHFERQFRSMIQCQSYIRRKTSKN